ncbi:MAG: hypothetical protein HC821_00625 [Lewinella sp.]|nr:hypothetical protein [Lewinella sp.]
MILTTEQKLLLAEAKVEALTSSLSEALVRIVSEPDILKTVSLSVYVPLVVLFSALSEKHLPTSVATFLFSVLGQLVNVMTKKGSELHHMGTAEKIDETAKYKRLHLAGV